MKLTQNLTLSFRSLKRRFYENCFENLLFLVDLFASLTGLSVIKDRITVPLWILYGIVFSYAYGMGSLVYLFVDAQDTIDYVKSYINIAAVIQMAYIGWWQFRNRSLLKLVIQKANKSDELAKRSPLFRDKHRKMFSNTKRILIVYYGIVFINSIFVYVPSRIALTDEYAQTPCVGISSLNTSPNRQLCTCILALQELFVHIVSMNYQGFVLFIISHTAGMYQLLSSEMMNLNSEEIDNAEVHRILTSVMGRHVLTLEVFDKFKYLYSSQLGVTFGGSAVCVAFFFYLPFEDWIKFQTMMVYCLGVLFLYCVLGQKLINAAEDFERAVYGCGWENFNITEKKIIYLMLIQAQKKVVLLAADIIPVNIYTFAVTCQSMFKFVTVVKI